MSNKDGPPLSNAPFIQYSIWSGMAGSIAALIMSTILSLNQTTSRYDTTLEPTVQELIDKFSEDAKNFVTALDDYCKTSTHDLPHKQTNYLTAPANSKQLIDFSSRNNKVPRMDTHHKHSDEQEETSQVCVIEEEISEVSNYTLDPITNKIKISTVEEYSKLAKCTVIKNQGIQAYDYIEDEKTYPDEKVNDNTIIHYNSQEEIQNVRASLEEQNELKLNVIKTDEIEDVFEPCEEIIIESGEDTQNEKVLPESNSTHDVNHENEKVSLEPSATSLSEGAEALLIKKLTDALYELKSKTATAANEKLPSEISETSLTESIEETLLKKITETFSTIKEIEETPNHSEKVLSESSETFMSPGIEEAILKKLTEKISELKTKQLSTSNISINTIEKFPEPVETTDIAIEAEPIPTNVCTQNTQTIQNVPNNQNFKNTQNKEVKEKVTFKKAGEVSFNKPNNVVRRDKSREPTEKNLLKRRTGAGAAEEFEKVIPKPRNLNKKDQKPKPQVKPFNVVEDNKKRNLSKSRPPAKPSK